MKATERLQGALERIDAMMLRERIFLLGGTLGLMLLAWDLLLMQPLHAEREAHGLQVARLQQQIGDLDRAVMHASGAASGDMHEDTRRRLAEVGNQLNELDRALAGLTGGLIDPAQMGAVLEELLARTSGVELISMRHLGAVALEVPADGAVLHRQGIALEVRGSYLAVLGYLQSIERLPWTFLWERFELQVESHPTTRARVVLYSLGHGQGLLGV